MDNVLEWIEAFDTDVGQFHVDTSDRATYGIQTDWSMRVTLYLPDSIMPEEETSITDAFLVSLKDPCADNQLSIAVSDELGDQLYYVGDPAKVVTPVVA